MKEQGNQAISDFNKVQNGLLELPKDCKPEDYLQKASYYYAQALLIFVYLIPENELEEKETLELEVSCHLNQSLVFMKMKRYEECLQELAQVLHYRADP